MLFIRKLDRYVMREFLKILGIGLVALTVITMLVHLMDHVNVYLDHEATWREVGWYYLHEVPYNLLLTLPMAMMIATILTIGDLGRHGELTAMKSSGISLYRLAAPIVVFSVGVSLGALALGETGVPRLVERSNEIYHEQVLGREPTSETYRGNFVFQNDAGYTYLVRSLFVDDSASRGEQVEIQRTYADGTFLRINAPRMIWEPTSRSWVLRSGEVRVFPGEDAPGSGGAEAASEVEGGGEPEAVPAGAGPAPDDDSAAAESPPAAEGGAAASADSAARVAERMYAFLILRSPHLDDPPRELLAEEKDPEEMGYTDLVAYIEKRDRLGADTRIEEVDLHMKFAYPFANLIIVLFGVGLVGSAAHAGRQTATTGFGFALFLTIVYWGFLRVSQGLGYGGGLPPPGAAWLANGIFLAVGAVLLVRART